MKNVYSSKPWLLAIAMTLGSTAIGSQGAPPQGTPSATGTIIGRVVDADSNKPIQGAVVSIATPAPTPGAPPRPPSGGPAQVPTPIITDADGSFVIPLLPAGRFDLSVAARGYLTQRYGARRPGGTSRPIELAAGQRIADVVVPLWKPAILSGTVTDDAGEALEGVQVGVLRKDIVSGRPRLSTVGAAVTDDRGRYRTTPLPPGQYLVCIGTPRTTMPTSGLNRVAQATAGTREEQAAINQLWRASNAPVGDTTSGYRIGDFVFVPPSGSVSLSPPPDENGRVRVVPSTYYPEATSPLEAATLRLGSGDVRTDIDVRTHLLPAVSVAGQVTRPDGGSTAHLGVRLALEAAGHLGTFFALEAGATLTDTDGRFTFLGVPPGAYLLRMTLVLPAASATTAAPPALAAVVPIAVGNRDVKDVAVTLREAPHVSGHVIFDGATTPPPSAPLFVEIQSVDIRYPSTPPVPRARITETGEFQTPGVTPGTYVLRATGLPGWTVKSALFEGRDISDTPFEASGNMDNVVVTMTDTPAELTGTVRRADGTADVDATVIVFPGDRALLTARRRQSARVSATGAYALRDLPAGDYLIVAIDDRFAGDWEDPALLETASRAATRVTIRDRDKRTLDLRTSAIRQEPK